MHDDGDHALLAPLWSQGTQGVVEGRLGVSIEPETAPPPVAGAELTRYQDDFFLGAADDGWQQRLSNLDRGIGVDGHHFSARHPPARHPCVVDQDIDPFMLYRRGERRDLRRVADLERMQDDVSREGVEMARLGRRASSCMYAPAIVG